MDSADAFNMFKLLSTQRSTRASVEVDPNALPYAALSYGLFGEDMILHKIFKYHILRRKPGFYVDIGCGSPCDISNTYHFYCMGWRGLCVDANNIWVPSWAALRSKDIFINAAIGENTGKTFLFRHESNRGMARISDTNIAPTSEYLPNSDHLPLVRLEALFAEHVKDRPIQFMTMDIEGAELGALRSNNWDRWRPEVIIMECHGFDFEKPYDEPSVRYLADQGYTLESKIGVNVLMIDKVRRSSTATT